MEVSMKIITKRAFCALIMLALSTMTMHGTQEPKRGVLDRIKSRFKRHKQNLYSMMSEQVPSYSPSYPNVMRFFYCADMKMRALVFAKLSTSIISNVALKQARKRYEEWKLKKDKASKLKKWRLS